MILDEHYIEAARWQFRSSLDRRFWHTSGGWEAIAFGVVDDFGEIIRSACRPFRWLPQ